MAPEEGIVAEMRQSLASHALEVAYEKSCRHVDSVYEAERARRLLVQNLLHEDECDNLHEQLAHADEHIDELESHNLAFREELEIFAGQLENAKGELRIKSREIETLKMELQSLNSVTMDSTKLLTEKLTLARELSSLRPELDHLRSQVASHQQTLVEKLSLQREVTTLQVELENEKRSTSRTIAKEKKAQAEDAKLEARVEALQAEVFKESRERQKIERESQKTSTEWENKTTTLESRLDAFRTKLKSTKEQLKEAQMELQRARAANSRLTANGASSASTVNNPRKRGAAQMDADTMIGTPGDLPAAKRSRKLSALPGEKSTFSITPFLNRTASVAPESSPPRDSPIEDPQVEDSPAGSKDGRVKSRAPESGLSNKPLENSSGNVQKKSASNKTTKSSRRPPPPRRAKSVPTLEQVIEEGTNEAGKTQAEDTVDRTAVDDEQTEEVEIKKKKRKIFGAGLGKTLFDEEDAEQPVKSRVSITRVGLGALGKAKTTAPRLGPARALSSAGGFGTISPLKKDKRVSA